MSESPEEIKYEKSSTNTIYCTAFVCPSSSLIYDPVVISQILIILSFSVTTART